MPAASSDDQRPLRGRAGGACRSEGRVLYTISAAPTITWKSWSSQALHHSPNLNRCSKQSKGSSCPRE